MIMRKQTTYSKELKQTILELLNNGQTLQQVSLDYDIPESTIRTWRRRYILNQDNQLVKEESDQEQEIKRLRKENKALKEERDILKKVVSIFS